MNDRAQLAREALLKEAKPFVIYEQTYYFAPLGLKGIELFEDLQKRIRTNLEAIKNDPAVKPLSVIDDWLNLFFLSASRVDSTITLEELRDVVDSKSYGPLTRLVMTVSGYELAKTDEQAPVEEAPNAEPVSQ